MDIIIKDITSDPLISKTIYKVFIIFNAPDRSLNTLYIFLLFIYTSYINRVKIDSLDTISRISINTINAVLGKDN